MLKLPWRTALVSAVAVLALAAASATAQTPAGPSVRLQGPQEEIPRNQKTVDLQLMVENVQNLGGFQFILNFDPKILEATGAEVGDFLGSSGREVLCKDPTIDEGALRFACVTLRQQPAGANGSGLLATVHLKVRGSGPTDLSLDKVGLYTPPGEIIPPAAITGSSLVVAGGSGTNWALWGTIIGLAAVAVVVLAGGGLYLLISRRSARSKAPAASA